MRVPQIVCPHCGRIRIHGVWQPITGDVKAILSSRNYDWYELHVYCDQCKEVSHGYQHCHSLSKL